MTATHSIPSTVLVAIDISKHRHEVLIGVPGKKRRRRMTIMNTLEDFHRLSAAWEYPKLCVSDRAHAVFRYGQASKRPANIMAS